MANDLSDGTIQPGVLVVEKILLTSPRTNKQLDIRKIVQEFAVYENINQPFVTGNFLLNDASSIFTLFPLTGDETIELSCSIPHSSYTKKLTKTFRVSSIEDTTTQNQTRLLRYTLRGVA